MNSYGVYKETKKYYEYWEKEKSEQYKNYRYKWEHNPENDVVEYAPINVDIEVTAACNLKCPMCLFAMERTKGGASAVKSGFMSWELYKKIVDEAAAIGVSAIKLVWRGEPLLHPDIVKMIQYAKKCGILDVIINTNAVCLNDELARDLISAGLDKIIFSVDSIDKDEYEQIRIGAKFEEVIENIKNFCEINKELGHPVLTRVQRVKMENTDEKQTDFEKFFSEIVDVTAYDECVLYGEELKELKEKFDKYPLFRCSQLWQRIIISWNGKCFMCCEDGREEYEIGNINDESLHDIWVGERLEYARKLHRENKWYMLDRCNNCAYPYMGL